MREFNERMRPSRCNKLKSVFEMLRRFVELYVSVNRLYLLLTISHDFDYDEPDLRGPMLLQPRKGPLTRGETRRKATPRIVGKPIRSSTIAPSAGLGELSQTDLVQLVMLSFLRTRLTMDNQRRLDATSNIDFGSAFRIVSITSPLGNALYSKERRRLEYSPTAFDVRDAQWRRERDELELRMSTDAFWDALSDRYYSDDDLDDSDSHKEYDTEYEGESGTDV